MVNSSSAVPYGYKKTDAGTIPEGWECAKLGQLFIFKNGLNKAKRFFGYGTPIVNYMDVYAQSGIRNADLVGKVSLDSKELKNFEVLRGDVFFTRTSETVDEIGITAVMLDEPSDTVFSGFILRARPIDNKLEALYKKYCFSTQRVRTQIISKSTYTTRALTNGRSLSVVSIAIPNKPEQRYIAEALSDTDELIQSLNKLIDKKRDIKKATMQQLLTGETSLPGFSGEWKTMMLGDVADIYNGATPSTRIGEYWDGSIPWCTPTDVTNTQYKYLVETERCITDMGLASCTASLLPIGTLLLCSRATIGEVKIAGCEVCTNQGFKSLVCTSDVSNEFLYYQLLTLESELIQRATGSTFLEINKRDVAAVLVELPEYFEQVAIATILSDMDIEITALEKRRDKTKAIKHGMMQALLTGRIRLIKPSS